MNKRITSVLLCFVMILAILATAVPVFAEENTNKGIFTVKVDKTTANPGDVINVSLILTPPSGKLTSFQGFFIADTGLTYVADSGKVPEGLKAFLGFDNVEWTESSKMVNGFGSTIYGGTDDIVLAELQYKVNDDAAVGSVLTISIEENEVCDGTIEIVESSVVPATVTVTAAPKPATGISLNKSELTLTVGDVDTSLTATVTPDDSTDTVVWSSDAPSVANVDSATGKVTAAAPGEAIITATAGTKTATCTVKVQAAPCAHENKNLIPEKASNCSERGWDEHQICNDCHQLFDMNGNPIDAIPYRDLNDDHDFNTEEWGYKEADGHAHVCNRNAEHHDTVMPHTAGPAATETTPQTCTECGFVMQAATGHVHADHLTKVDKEDATCTADGNKEYYRCTCGKLFEDAAAATEITDHSSVVLPKTGHSYTVQNSDEDHKRSTAADCREFDTYWYTCANDATHSAKDDAAAADKFYNGEQGAHVYGNEWVDCGETGHAHKCQYHDAYDAVQPHTPDHEEATFDHGITCTECGYVIAPQLEESVVRVEVPFKLTVKKTGEMDPGKETFKFVVERFGAPVEYVLVQDTVETNGEKTYEGKFIFTIRESLAGNLSEGFVIRQVKGNSEGWTYDETKFYAIPGFADTYTNIVGWRFLKYDENAELDYNNPIDEIVFTNSYNAKAPINPNPDTSDGLDILIWIVSLSVSCAALAGITLYSRKRRTSGR